MFDRRALVLVGVMLGGVGAFFGVQYMLTLPPPPKEFITKIQEQLRATSSGRDLNLNQRQAAFTDWIRQHVDIASICATVIGPPWIEWSEEDRMRAQDLMIKFLGRRFSLISPRLNTAEIEIRQVRNDSSFGTRVLASARLPGQPWTNIEIRLEPEIGRWLIRDVIIEDRPIVRQIVLEIKGITTLKEFEEKLLTSKTTL